MKENLDKLGSEIINKSKTISIIIFINLALFFALLISILYQGYYSYKKLNNENNNNKMSDDERRLRRLNYRHSILALTMLIGYIIIFGIVINMKNKLMSEIN
jgi:hypothetical protein